MQIIGSRAQVMHGNAKMTGGGLKKKDLKYNKHGKIVSKKLSAKAKKYYSKGGCSNNNNNGCNKADKNALDVLKQDNSQNKVKIYSMDEELLNIEDKLPFITKFDNIIVILSAGDGPHDVKKYYDGIIKQNDTSSILYVFCHLRYYDPRYVVLNAKYIRENDLEEKIILCEFNFKIETERINFKKLFGNGVGKPGKIDKIYTDDRWSHREGIFSLDYIHSLLKEDGEVHRKVLLNRNYTKHFDGAINGFHKKKYLTSSNLTS